MKYPRDFEKNNVLYHYLLCNKERLVIGKYCSVACGVKFMFTGGNHTLKSLSTYPFPVFPNEWNLDEWIGYETVIMQGVTVDDGAIGLVNV